MRDRFRLAKGAGLGPLTSWIDERSVLPSMHAQTPSCAVPGQLRLRYRDKMHVACSLAFHARDACGESTCLGTSPEHEWQRSWAHHGLQRLYDSLYCRTRVQLRRHVKSAWPSNVCLSRPLAPLLTQKAAQALPQVDLASEFHGWCHCRSLLCG